MNAYPSTRAPGDDGLETCLVFDKTTKTWRLDRRPPLPPVIPERFQWSSELHDAAEYYRKTGEKT